MKIRLSVVILAMTISEELYKMTCDCIDSLLKSEPNTSLEIIIVESNKNYQNSNLQYPDFVKVIIPEAEFNFHKFLNIGIRNSKGDYIALCNNDLIFHDNWFTEILKVATKKPGIKSFSPNGELLDKPNAKDFEIGYKVQTHIKGWCIVAERSIFSKMNYLDETFDFYYADNDYAMSLKMHNIRHAVVYNSYVEHLEKKSSCLPSDSTPQKVTFLHKYKIPDYLVEDHYARILQNEKGLSGFLKFYAKWGHPKWVYRKNKIAEVLFKLNLGIFVRFLFAPKKGVNIFKNC